MSKLFFGCFVFSHVGIKQLVFGGKHLGDWDDDLTTGEDGLKSYKIWNCCTRLAAFLLQSQKWLADLEVGAHCRYGQEDIQTTTSTCLLTAEIRNVKLLTWRWVRKSGPKILRSIHDGGPVTCPRGREDWDFSLKPKHSGMYNPHISWWIQYNVLSMILPTLLHSVWQVFKEWREPSLWMNWLLSAPNLSHLSQVMSLVMVAN